MYELKVYSNHGTATYRSSYTSDTKGIYNVPDEIQREFDSDRRHFSDVARPTYPRRPINNQYNGIIYYTNGNDQFTQSSIPGNPHRRGPTSNPTVGAANHVTNAGDHRNNENTREVGQSIPVGNPTVGDQSNIPNSQSNNTMNGEFTVDNDTQAVVFRPRKDKNTDASGQATYKNFS